MNEILEVAVIAAVVGLAGLFVARRVLSALRGGRPSCCTDEGEATPLASQLTGAASCADGEGPDGKVKPRPSYCAGCSGCG